MTEKNLLINLWRVWSFLESSSVFFPISIWMIWQNTNKHIKTLWCSLLAYAYIMEKTGPNKPPENLQFPIIPLHSCVLRAFFQTSWKRTFGYKTSNFSKTSSIIQRKSLSLVQTSTVLERKLLKFPSLGWLSF